MKMSFLRTFLLFFILLSISEANGQQLMPLGNGIMNRIEASCFHERYLYVIYESDKLSMDSIQFRVSKWNGNYWQHLPEFTVVFNTSTISYEITSMVFYKDELYVAGNFPAVEGIENSSNIIKLEGSQWQDVGDGILPVSHWFFVRNMIVYKDDLYVSGLFNSAGSVKVNNIAKWNGTNWNKVSDGLNDLVLDLGIYDDQLFAAGLFDSSGTLKTGPLAWWENNKWNMLENDFLTISEIETIDKDLFVFGDSYNDSIIQRWDGSYWTGNTFNLDINSSIYSFANVKGELWAATYAEVDGVKYNLIKWNKNNWIPILKTSNFYNINKVTSAFDELYLSGDFDTIGSLLLNNIAIYNSSSGKISGSIYYDQNKNCIKDINDIGISNRMVEIQPGDIFVATDDEGRYEYNIEPGSYTVKHMQSGFHINSCNPDNYIIEINHNTTYEDLDFATSNNVSNQYDLSVSLSGKCGWRARYGFEEQYTVLYENLGDIPIPTGTINLSHDENLEFITSMPLADDYILPTISWYFTDLLPGEKRKIKLTLKIPLDIKDDIINTCNGIPLIGDMNNINNFDTLLLKPVGAIDPNDKQCFPQGLIKPETTKIDYMIRFQNTGTDTAYRVMVIDTVDIDYLPIREVIINTVSHPFVLTIRRNILTWTFNQIMLPDSSVNMKESHGFIRYTAKLKPNIATGDTIENKAYIYFDYQKAVPTNKTINIIDSSKVDNLNPDSSELIIIYPNPAYEEIIIKNDNPTIQDLKLINLYGVTINEFKIPNNSLISIDVSVYSSGVYFIVSDNLNIRKKLIIFRKR